MARPIGVTLLLPLVLAGLSGCLGGHDNAWALDATRLDALMGQGFDGHAVRVAILDTGIDLDAPGLAHLDDGDRFNGEMVAYGDFVGESAVPRDRDGHGTFVAGVLAGARGDGLARLSPRSVVPGPAPNVELVIGRVSVDGQGSLRALGLALEWSLDQQADVISLSLGVPLDAIRSQPDTAERFRQTLARAEAEGVLVVAAAGNAGPLLYPAHHGTVLAVAAVDRDLQPLRYDALGGKRGLYAPGRDVSGPWPDGGIVGVDGSSAAVPFVTAAAALLMSAAGEPDDTGGLADLREALLLGGRTVQPGVDLLDAESALRLYRQALLRNDPNP